MEYSVVLIAPSQQIADLFQSVARDHHRRIPVFVGQLEDGVAWATRLARDPLDVIISRGGTASAIRQLVQDVPVVEIPVTGFDILRALAEARKITNRVLIAGFHPFTSELNGFSELLGMALEILPFDSEARRDPGRARERVLEYKGKGCCCVVGDTYSVGLARELGMESVLIDSGRAAMVHAIEEAERVAVVRRLEAEKTERIKCITDFASEGIVSIAKDGTIELLNPSAEKILGLAARDVLGKHVLEVLPGFESGSAFGERELGKIITCNERKIVANIVPVRISDETQRVVATFQKLSGLISMEGKIRRDLAKTGLTARHSFRDIIGQSAELNRVRADAEQYAQFSLPVLLLGETGTGKELFAQAIHNASPRAAEPFVGFNCAALPSGLLESELFGYADGAFTGATKGGNPGIFELAHGGTIFLDEIGEISLETQVRLLRVLEEHTVRRIGDHKLTPVNVRVVVATNQDLGRLVEEKKFRRDLFYRINVLVLALPPLRARKEDVPLLVDSFVQKHGMLFGKSARRVTPEALELLAAHEWPGNIRQLENVIERMVIKCKGETIGASLVRDVLRVEPGLSQDTRPSSAARDGDTTGLAMQLPPGLKLSDMIRLIIQRAIDDAEGNREIAAQRLGIGRTTIWRKTVGRTAV